MVGNKREESPERFNIEKNITEEILSGLDNIGHLYYRFVSREYYSPVPEYAAFEVDVTEPYVQHYINMLENHHDPLFTKSVMCAYIANHFNNAELGLCNYMVLSGWLHAYLVEYYSSSGSAFHKMH